jgi:filamentous hemagglutinin
VIKVRLFTAAVLFWISANAVASTASGGGNRNQTLNALSAYAKGSDAMEQGKDGLNAMQNGGSMAQGAAAAGVKLTVSVCTSKSSSTTYNNTQVGAGNTLTIKSGGDTNLRGATATGTQVNATIGGNLNIESLQDTATIAAKQQTTGVALSIPITGAGQLSASVSQQA